ncbi:MAG: hypothetical protein H7Y18_13660 [Clostridiaceae bacterium]|nr:hypothetical protein [Clostridiaceae bacterium]
MLKKLLLSFILTILVVFVLFIAYNSKKAEIETKGGLKIQNWSSSLGSINETDLDKTIFSYSVYLTNQNEKSIFIRSIQPSVNEAVKYKIISIETVVSVNKDIKPNETIQINGEIILDTKGLLKQDIVKLEPFITDIKVSTEETISLKR